MTAFYVVLATSTVVVCAAAAAHAGWIDRTGAVPHVLAEAEQADLLEAIREAATEPQMRITLNGFWRDRGWNRRQTYFLLRPLIQQRILHIPYSSDVGSRMLEALWYGVLSQPPGAVILNSRDWTRMATDASGNVPNIIVGNISGGMNQIGGTDNFMTQQEFAAEQVAELIHALRADARQVPEVSEDACAIADGLESDHARGRVGGVSKWMESAAKLVNATSTIMESTNEVLRRLGLI